VVPGIIGATGTISNSFRKYVSTIPNNIVLLRDMVCLRNICKNTLHKGESYDNDNNNNIKFECENLPSQYISDTTD
jgi:hypothetical protein